MSLLTGVPAGSAAVASDSSTVELAAAVEAPAGDIVSASLGESDSLDAAVGGSSLSFFPRKGSTFAILSSGLATSADDPDANDNETLGGGGAGDDVSYELAGLNNSQENDLVQLSLALTVLEGFGCLAFDFAYYSEEFPDFINSAVELTV